MLNKKLKNIKYNIKNSMVIGALAASSLLPVSCGKEDPVDPIKAKQEQLKKIDAQLTKEIRVAIPNAKTNPNNITNAFEGAMYDFARAAGGYQFNGLRDSYVVLKDIRDSVNVYNGAIEGMFEEYGNPSPNNAESVAKLYSLTQKSIANYAEMQKMGVVK